jgi:zinc/manganese transport system substrate-binding protein
MGTRRRGNLRVVAMLGTASLLTLGLSGCVVGASGTTGRGPVQVVAAENVWGSIAAQLGGNRVQVTSIISNPNADPHDYEPTAADARSMASAGFVIVNGIGYDPWAQKLLAANPVPGREVLDVGALTGVPAGGNPHRWYSPPDVQRVIDAITAGFEKLDPKDHAYFEQRRSRFETTGLAEYHRLITDVHARYAGVPVGASESIFAPVAQALGLNLITPPSFLSAISEGTEPTAGDKATIDRQIQSREIKVYVYNSQNATPDVQRQIDEARRAGIPIATITETLVPADAPFQVWQARQLRALAAALAQATGR